MEMEPERLIAMLVFECSRHSEISLLKWTGDSGITSEFWRESYTWI